jgi:pimeloyl-ACP methyl ester carboxylesterase
MMSGDGVEQRSAVEQASIPTAMLNGSQDPLLRISYLDSLKYSNLWEGKCHVIVGAGHSPFWQTPETFNLIMHRFMTDISIRRAPAPETEVARRA